MASFYIRADGTASKANAIGPDTDPSACMTLAVHNAATFAAGDIIYISAKGGEFVDQLVPPSSGAGGIYIYYEGIGKPVISGNGTWSFYAVIKAWLWFTGIIFTTSRVYMQNLGGVFNYCIFKNCTNTTGMIFANTGTVISLRNCIIHGSAGHGVYISTAGMNFTLRNCIFYGNILAAISTVNGNIINYDYCLFIGNNTLLSTNLSLGTSGVDGGHNIIEDTPDIDKYKNNTAYFVFTIDEATLAPYTAYMVSVADAVEPYGVRITVYPQINPLDAADGSNLLALHNRGHEIGIHTWTHTRMTRTLLFAATSTNAAPTINYDVANSQIILATTTPGNSVTYNWTGDKRISDLQAAVVGKGWTITPSVGISTAMFLSSGADTVGAQAVPYTINLDRSAPNYAFFYNEVDKVRDYLETIIGVVPKYYAWPENAWDADAQAYLFSHRVQGARGNGVADLSSINIYNILTVSLNTIKEAGTESIIRQLAQHYYTRAKDNGHVIVFLAHSVAEFSIDQWTWLVDELTKMESEFYTFGKVIEKIKSDHATLDYITYTKTYSDISSYYLQRASPAINAGIDVGLAHDLDGRTIIGTPSIGVYEYMPHINIGIRGKLNSNKTYSANYRNSLNKLV